MTYQERNTTVTLVSFTAILAYFLTRILQMLQARGLLDDALFQLWIIVILAAIRISITATILTNIIYGIVTVIRTQEEPTYVEDERDKLVSLKGTRIQSAVNGLGTFVAMLSFVLGQPALVMFALLIVAGLVGQITGDIARLFYYRRGA